MIDYATILIKKYPNTEWTLNGDNYEGLTWLSETAKPTKKQLDDLWSVVKDELKAEVQAKATAKATAQAKLAVLGLTVADLEALGL